MCAFCEQLLLRLGAGLCCLQMSIKKIGSGAKNKVSQITGNMTLGLKQMLKDGFTCV